MVRNEPSSSRGKKARILFQKYRLCVLGGLRLRPDYRLLALAHFVYRWRWSMLRSWELISRGNLELRAACDDNSKVNRWRTAPNRYTNPSVYIHVGMCVRGPGDAWDWQLVLPRAEDRRKSRETTRIRDRGCGKRGSRTSKRWGTWVDGCTREEVGRRDGKNWDTPCKMINYSSEPDGGGLLLEDWRWFCNANLRASSLLFLLFYKENVFLKNTQQKD